MANYKQITRCRICNNKLLTKIGGLGLIAISDFTPTPQKGTKMPLTLVFCSNCTLVQLAHNFNRDLLYKDYWYVSGLNKAIVTDLKEIAEYSQGKDSHIDIGGNDGTLLKYSKARVKALVDPSNTVKTGDYALYNTYWENAIVFTDWELITAIACLYDLPSPNRFIKKVKDSLAPNGLFISQFQPLSQMVELNDVGNICHEHLEYYSYKSLVYLFEQNGLEIFKVEQNKMNGGSYRVFARHFTKSSIKFKEKEYGTRELKAFFSRIEDNKQKMIEFAITHRDLQLVGFGASTKAGTICQYYGLWPQEVVDVNPEKLGKYTIYESQIINKIPSNTDYLWVFPYGFLDYFKQKEKKYKGKWLTTIPKFKIS